MPPPPWCARPAPQRVGLNLGGIANITVLPGDDAAVTGFDTGPGNTLLDAWILRHEGKSFDAGGEWAAGGAVDEGLLARMRADPYFSAPPPKSTGFEYFNLDWLERMGGGGIAPRDVQATLAELTAGTIADAVRSAAPATSEMFVCGGGIHNDFLVARIRALLPGIDISPTSAAGLHPDWVEAAAFAWLAMRTISGQPGNLPSVTGAREAVVLGRVFPGAENA